MSDIYNRLLELWRNPTGRKPQTYVVNIDDLLWILRQFRAAGYRVRRDPERIEVDGRTRKKAIWFITTSFDNVVDTLLVDTTRRVPRGQIYVSKTPDFTIKVDRAIYDYESVLFRRSYSWRQEHTYFSFPNRLGE